jgi:biotin synthase
MPQPYDHWTSQAINDCAASSEDARRMLSDDTIELMALIAAAGQVREHFHGRTVSIHILDNVRNGACPEDCGYCGQSKDSTAPIQPYKLKSPDAILADAAKAKASGAYRFCMAMAGRGPGDREIEHMCEVIKQVKAMGLRTCLSAGLIDGDKAARLADAGLDRFNHNLNTSRRNYPSICTTHTYDDRLESLHALRDSGVGLCSGMIVGMGEEYDDLVEVAMELRSLRAESIPVNFLLPIEGNRVADPGCAGVPITPQLVLRVLCMMRLTNPTAELRIAAGREAHLRSLQPLSLWPANSLFMDGYLLSEGSSASATIAMIRDAGFEPKLDEGELPEALREQLESPTPGSSPTVPLKVSVRSPSAPDPVA